MEKEINEISKKLNWYERIIIKIFKKTFIKVYNLIRIKIVNQLLWDLILYSNIMLIKDVLPTICPPKIKSFKI